MARMFVAGVIMARVIGPGLLVSGVLSVRVVAADRVRSRCVRMAHMVVTRMALFEFRRSLVIPFRVHIVNLYPLGV